MEYQPSDDAIRYLILTRLLDPGDSGLTPINVRKDLSPLVQHRILGEEWIGLFETCWTSLFNDGLIENTKAKRSVRAVLTAKGREAALAFLGVNEIPEKTVWGRLKNVYLVSLSLGLRLDNEKQKDRLAKVDGLRAAILQKKRALKVPEFPTLKQAFDALLWRALDVETDAPFHLNAVKEHLLNPLVNTPRRQTLEQLAKLLPSQEIGARRSDKSELQMAALRSLVDGIETAAPKNRTVDESQSNATFDLSAFAENVILTARNCQTGWFGTQKIFISHVWWLFREMHRNYNLDKESFQSRLVEAHQNGLLTLSRADLVEAMDPGDVAASETRHLNACYHFIRFDGGDE